MSLLYNGNGNEPNINDFELEENDMSIEPLKEDYVDEELQYPLPAIPFLWLWFAKRGSGKTTAMINVLLKWLKNVFHIVYIFCPTFYADSKWRYIKISKDQVFRKYDDDIARDILEAQIELIELIGKKKSPNILMIFDDLASNKSFTSYQLNAISDISFLGRHYKVSSLITSQKIKSLPPKVRSQADAVVAFRLPNQPEYKVFEEEYCQIYPPLFKQFYDEVTKNKAYDFMYVKTKGVGTYCKNLKPYRPKADAICQQCNINIFRHLLPCQHKVCNECVGRFAKKKDGKEYQGLECPVCKQRIVILGEKEKK
jgi:hypothetical protein